MELRAKRDFTDRVTNTLYKKDDVLKVTKDVGERLLKSPYDVVELVDKKEVVKENDKGVQTKTNKKSKNNT